MNVETNDWNLMMIVGVMTAVTLVTRWGGVFVMSFLPIGHRARQFIAAMSGSVLVALLAPLAIQGDGAARLALATTAAVMLLLKKPLPAIAAGILAAAMLRQF
jgi:uncharacterized membrane protein